MPNWFQRAQLPDRYKDMSPDQIEADIKRLEALEAENATLKGAPPAVEKPEESQAYKNLELQLQQATEELRRVTTPRPPEDTGSSKLTSFLEDEDRAFQERATPLFNMTLQNTSMMARQIAEQELREDIDLVSRESNRYVMSNYSKEINDLYNSMPLQARVAPDAFKNVVGVVKHRHFQDVYKAVSGKSQQFESAGGTSEKPSEDSNAPAEKQLNAGELRVAKQMKMSPADYLKAKKGMSIATETTGYAQVKT